jgi:hypothetical protein
VERVFLPAFLQVAPLDVQQDAPPVCQQGGPLGDYSAVLHWVDPQDGRQGDSQVEQCWAASRDDPQDDHCGWAAAAQYLDDQRADSPVVAYLPAAALLADHSADSQAVSC